MGAGQLLPLPKCDDATGHQERAGARRARWRSEALEAEAASATRLHLRYRLQTMAYTETRAL